MADSFFGTEFDSSAGLQEPDQYAFGGYEEQPQYAGYSEQQQSNGALNHDGFYNGAESIFPADDAQDYVPASEFDAVPTSGYPADESFFSSAAPISFTEPEVDDPRVLWSIKNREYLAEKDHAERQGKEELGMKAREYFESFYQTRGTTLQQRKDANREDEREKTATALPQGSTPWEKVHSLLNFNSDVPTKDVSRYKSTLFTCKNNNVPVHSPPVETA